MSYPAAGPQFPPIVPPSFWQPVIYYNSPVAMGPAGNGQLLLGYADGHVYSFNPQLAATTLLEDLVVRAKGADGSSSGLLWFVGGFINDRVAAYDSDSPNNTALAHWQSDTQSVGASAAASTESSIWDFDLPEQTMILDGIHVVCSKPTGGDRVTIAYQIDQSGTWVNLPAITSSATGLKHYLPVSDASTTIKLSTLQFRTTVAGNVKVYSVTAQARVPGFSETWEILVKLQDEEPGQRTSKRQTTGDVLRQYLWDTMRSKSVVLYRDGYVSGKTGNDATPSGGFNEYAVTVEGIDDFIDIAGSGKARVTVRRVLTTDDS